MSKTAHDKHMPRKLVLGVGLDEESATFLTNVANFLKRLPVDLHLVHAIEPWQGAPWLSTYPGEGVSFSVGKVVEEKAYEQAETALQRHAALLKEHVQGELTTAIVKGVAADALLNEAHDVGAQMLVSGISSGAKHFFEHGFSTSLSLANQTHLPVLMIPADKKLSFGEKSWRFLLCDDLRPESAPMISASLNFASAFRPVAISHLHVARLGVWDIRAMPSYVLETFAGSGALGTREELTQEELVDSVQGQLVQMLRHRAEDALAWTHEVGAGEYLPEVRFGKPSDEITKIADMEASDLIILGRHEAIHRRPFGLGKVPVQAALRTGKPLLIWPDPKGMSARLPSRSQA